MSRDICCTSGVNIYGNGAAREWIKSTNLDKKPHMTKTYAKTSEGASSEWKNTGLATNVKSWKWNSYILPSFIVATVVKEPIFVVKNGCLRLKPLLIGTLKGIRWRKHHSFLEKITIMFEMYADSYVNAEIMLIFTTWTYFSVAFA